MRFSRSISPLFSLVLPVAALLAIPRSAAAEEAARVYVVDVRPAAARVDGAKVRARIASDLHADVVAPDDPRSASAQGVATVDVDAESHALVVTYVARSAPQTRTLPPSVNDEDAGTAVAVVVGNLARDEAGELADALRKKKTHAETTSVAPATTERERTEPNVKVIIADHVERETKRARVIGWSATGLGVAASTAGIAMAGESNLRTQSTLLVVSGAMLGGIGLGTLIMDGPYLELSHATNNYDAASSAGIWERAAAREHSDRRFSGFLGLGIGVASLATGTIIAVDQKLSMGIDPRTSWATTFIAIGAVDTALAIFTLGTDGPLESGWKTYQAITGRTPAEPASGALRTRPRFTAFPLQGGGGAAFSGTF
jgi:hypothetical protein